MTHPYVSVEEACSLLLDERVVAIPTETVYGLAGLATSPLSVQRIYDIKHRPSDNPLICHFHTFEAAIPYLLPYPAYVNALVRYFSPGPISYLLPLRENSGLEHAVRHLPNVIVRIPAHQAALDILESIGLPLAAPSANTSGRFSPTTAQMVATDLGEWLDGIVDGGACASGIESTIVDCTRIDKLRILRPGSIGERDLRDALTFDGFNLDVIHATGPHQTPGNRHRHYAPQTPIRIIDELDELPNHGEPVCVLVSQEKLKAAQACYSTYDSQPIVLEMGSEVYPDTIGQVLYARLALIDALNLKQAYIVQPRISDPDWKRAIDYRLEKMTESR